MVISINDASEIPIYQQIRNQIVLGISDGRLAPGEQLPTVRALAEEIGINSMTVSKAYTLLKQEGYIYTDRRSGARVRQEFETNKELSEKSQELLRQIISEAKVSGMTQTEFFDLCKRRSQPDLHHPAQYFCQHGAGAAVGQPVLPVHGLCGPVHRAGGVREHHLLRHGADRLDS